MTTGKSKPHIVVVPGAWHVPEHYAAMIGPLQQRGYKVSCPLLPTCSNTRPAAFVFEDDVAVVHNLLAKILDEEPSDIFVIAHSYGGKITTDAVKGVTRKARREQSLPGGVGHILFLAAIVMLEGPDAPMPGFPRAQPDPIDWNEDGTSFPLVDPKSIFYNCTDAKTAERAESLLVRHCHSSLQGGATYLGWRDVPFTYVTTTKDNVLKHEWQGGMLEDIRAHGVETDVRTFDTDHSPFLSMTAETLELVEELLEKLPSD